LVGVNWLLFMLKSVKPIQQPRAFIRHYID
jgi:hypothetical protein